MNALPLLSNPARPRPLVQSEQPIYRDRLSLRRDEEGDASKLFHLLYMYPDSGISNQTADVVTPGGPPHLLFPLPYHALERPEKGQTGSLCWDQWGELYSLQPEGATLPNFLTPQPVNTFK